MFVYVVVVVPFFFFFVVDISLIWPTSSKQPQGPKQVAESNRSSATSKNWPDVTFGDGGDLELKTATKRQVINLAPHIRQSNRLPERKYSEVHANQLETINGSDMDADRSILLHTSNIVGNEPHNKGAIPQARSTLELHDDSMDQPHAVAHVTGCDQDAKVDLDWATMLARHDLFWNFEGGIPPSRKNLRPMKWLTAAYVGNGQLGAKVLSGASDSKRGGGDTLSIHLGRTDIWDTSTGTKQGNQRLPVGEIVFFTKMTGTRIRMRQSLYTAQLDVDIVGSLLSHTRA